MRTPYRILMLFGALCSLAAGGEAESTEVILPEVARYNYDAMPKDPVASAFFSFTLPAAGQLYNREFVRAAAFGGTFYAGFFTAHYFLAQWRALNTDTFYVEDAYNPEIVHRATALKPRDEMVGLPRAQKAGLFLAVSTAAVSYVWGIIDAYQGANRFNETLLPAGVPVKLGLECNPRRDGLKVKAEYVF